MRTRLLTTSPVKTKKIAGILASEVLKFKSPYNHAFIIGLSGDLGSGKTTFVKGFAGGLGIKRRILSPTFILIKRYSLRKKNFKSFYHIDCYRLKNIKDIKLIKIDELISNPENLIVIEWVDKIKKLLPKNFINIVFKHESIKERFIEINYE